MHVSYVLNEAGSDFIALSGIELLCYPMLTPGGRGHLSCVGNFAPEPVARLYEAFVSGHHQRARSLHYDLRPLVDSAFAQTNPGAPVSPGVGHAHLGLRRAPGEYYFFGDPVRMAAALVTGYDRGPYRERVRAFLDQDDPAPAAQPVPGV